MNDQQIIASSRNTPIEPAEGESVESFFLNIPDDTLAMTNSGDFPVQPMPSGIPVLSEPELRNSLVTLGKVRDADGNLVGLISQLENFHEGDVFGDEPVAWDTYVTILVPGRGTILLHHQACMPDAARKIAGPIMAANEDWQGKVTFVTSIGPLNNGRGRIAGGTGEFEGLTGSFVAIPSFTKFTPPGEMHLSPVELRIFKEKRRRS